MSRLPPISSLILSPPEADMWDNFHSTTADFPKMTDGRKSAPRHVADVTMSQALSPPESPDDVPHRRDFVKPPSSLSIVDPAVFPQENDENEAPRPDSDQVTFFPPIQDQDLVDAVIQRHMQSQAVHYMRPKSKGDKRTLRYQPPSKDEYLLAYSFVSTLRKQDPREHIRHLREENTNDYYQAKRLGARPNVVHLQPKPAKLAIARPNAARVLKPASAPRKPTTPRVRHIPHDGDSPRPGRGGTPHVRKREPKRPQDDKYWEVPDKTPSLDLLDSNPKALRVDWDSTPMDLSNDPDRSHLHEAELNLASALRLTCARYLTCKRRIFNARVEALRIGKEFKKTDAQQNCQVDVNKASKLWVAFDKVGWFQPQLFKQYL